MFDDGVAPGPVIVLSWRLFMFRWLVIALILFGGATASASADSVNGLRQIEVPTVIGDTRDVLAENGVPNGMPCWWYDYATIVGLDYCDHPGMDIFVNYEPLYAATDGIVEFSGYDGYYVPDHVDLRVTKGPYTGEQHIYGHMSSVAVVPGQEVKRGDLLGISGEAGTAPHLHFERRTPVSEVCIAGCALDPEPVLTDLRPKRSKVFKEWDAFDPNLSNEYRDKKQD